MKMRNNVRYAGALSKPVAHRPMQAALARAGELVRQPQPAIAPANVAIGPGAAAGVGRMPASEIFEAGRLDVTSFVVAVAVLTLAALGACWAPARRAMRVDPIIALRHE